MAEREGFVLEFCEAQHIFVSVCLAKSFGHRYKTSTGCFA